jgi:hypothetical protein
MMRSRAGCVPRERVRRRARASTPQMRKAFSSTVASPRPPCTGHSTLRPASAQNASPGLADDEWCTHTHRTQGAHCSMELSPAANSTTCSKSGCARLRGVCAHVRQARKQAGRGLKARAHVDAPRVRHCASRIPPQRRAVAPACAQHERVTQRQRLHAAALCCAGAASPPRDESAPVPSQYTLASRLALLGDGARCHTSCLWPYSCARMLLLSWS